MITKYHNHKLQTNSRYCEEELQDITVTRYPKDNKSKATSSLFFDKMIAKLERTLMVEQKTGKKSLI